MLFYEFEISKMKLKSRTYGRSAYRVCHVLDDLLQSACDPALLNQDQAQEVRTSLGNLGRNSHWSTRMGSGTAAGRELEIELALATRKLGASTQHSSTDPRIVGI